jgi:hypothetical protein
MAGTFAFPVPFEEKQYRDLDVHPSDLSRSPETMTRTYGAGDRAGSVGGLYKPSTPQFIFLSNTAFHS